MISISNFDVAETLYTSRNITIFRGYDSLEKKKVIVKLLNAENQTEENRAAFKREYEVLSSLKTQGVVRAYDLRNHNDSLIMVLEDIGGRSLAELLFFKTLELEEFLRLAERIAVVLGEIHEQQIIHLNVNPSNIIWSPETDRLVLIDFKLSTRLSRRSSGSLNQGRLEETLAYISPEQTGRTNSQIDYRSDYYSLGVSFFELLTGRLPFKAEDTMGWIYAHLSQVPLSPAKTRSDIPEAVADVVLKLMAKDADDRYQSSKGLIADLNTCMDQWQRHRKIDDFKPGKKDVSERFRIPRKLYGREAEIDRLMAVFDEVARGNSELMLISGAAGVGKTALINEVQKPLVRKRGVFVKGKCERYQQYMPFSAIAKAFDELIQQLLTESEERLLEWKAELLKAMEPNGHILVDIVPGFEKIVGPLPGSNERNPEDAQNRLFSVFHKVLKVFTQKGRPFTVFLDDLQWCDFPSLRLMIDISGAEDTEYLLVICAYRDDEIAENRPLKRELDEIESRGPVHHLHIESLTGSVVNRMMADTLHCDLKRSRSITDVILQKTRGNPLFINELLKDLHEKKYLDFYDGVWRWDLEKIEGTEIDNDIIEFLIACLKKMPPETQKVLMLAACLGNRFDLRTLGVIVEKPPVVTAKALWVAVRQGIIIPLNPHYRFVHEHNDLDETGSDFGVSYQFQHDRLQQAAFSLIGVPNERRTRLRVGRSMLNGLTDEECRERAIDIVRFLEGTDETLETREIEKLAGLYLAAGKKARQSTAYDTALKFLKTGYAFLPEGSWENQYELCFAMVRELAECCYLCVLTRLVREKNWSSLFEEANQYCGILLQNARTELEKAEIYYLQAIQLTDLVEINKALEAGLSGLSLMGMKTPRNPGWFRIFFMKVLLLKWKLGGKNAADFTNLPVISDPEQLMSLKLLDMVTVPAFGLKKEKLADYLICKQIAVTLKKGLSPQADYNFWYLGGLLTNFGQPERGLAFIQLAIELTAQSRDPKMVSKSLVSYSQYTLWRMRHWKTILPDLKKALENGIQSGDRALTKQAFFLLLFIESEFDLKNALRICDQDRFIIKQSKYYKIYRNRCLIFHDYEGDPVALIRDTLDEFEAFIRKLPDGGDVLDVRLPDFNIFKLEICYHFNDYASALECIEAIDDSQVQEKRGIHTIPRYTFTFLTLSACIPRMERKKRRHAWKRLKKEYARAKVRADYCPDNFLHHKLMMEAEMARLAGKDFEAMGLYEKAIRAAKKNGYVRYEALANELAARFYLDGDFETIAAGYLRSARDLYRRWGSLTKVRDLEKRYPRLRVQPETGSFEDPDGSFPPFAADDLSNTLDLKTVLQTSQTISGEMSLDTLLEKVMTTVIENAGAQNGVLLTTNQGKWSVAAEADGLSKKTSIPEQKPLDDFDDEDMDVAFCAAIVRYVVRTGERVVLDDTTLEGRFARSPYIIRRKPKSVLCMPLLIQNNTIGILYLENNSTRGAFTRDRLEILNSLSTQMAISIQNAGLYQSLQAASQKLEEQNRRLMEKDRLKDQFLVWATNPDSVKAALGHIVTLLADIQYVESDKNYCFVVTKEVRKHLQINLKDIAKHFPEHLIQVHKSYLINPEKALKLKREGRQHRVHFGFDDRSIPVGATYLENTKKVFKNLLIE
ncbi:MAG: AAA family ATPase [Proteobacteria bacterium]|nr:AAA family ATPase [Pseudomonadota bacterium]